MSLLEVVELVVRWDVHLNRARLAVAVSLIIWVLTSAWSPAVALADAVTATLSPTSVTLTTGASAVVSLVISDGLSVAITDVAAAPVSPDSAFSIAIDKASTAPTSVLAGAAVVVNYVVTRVLEGTGQTVAVPFAVTYLRSDTGASGAVVATLSVTEVPSSALTTTTIQSNVTNINENRSGEADLVITNPREVVVDVDAIRITAPRQVDVEVLYESTDPQCKHPEVDFWTTGGTTNGFVPGVSVVFPGVKSCPMKVGDRSEQVMRLHLTTKGPVTPGSRTLLIQVDASDPQTLASGSSFASMSFTVDVFAESDVLKTLGIPIFLLLPGSVMVAVLGFFALRIWPWYRQLSFASEVDRAPTAATEASKAAAAKADSAKTDNSPSSLTSSLTMTASNVTILAVFSFALSLVMALVYPWLTQHVWGGEGQPRNYISAYDFEDFQYVFVYAFALGLIAGVFGVLAAGTVRYGLPDRLKEAYRWRESLKSLPAGKGLQVEDGQQFMLHYGFDGWSRVFDGGNRYRDRDSSRVRGAHRVRLTGNDLRGIRELNFTRFYPGEHRWEGVDQKVRVDT